MNNLNILLEQIDTDHLSLILKNNFEAEKMDKFFEVDSKFVFKGSELNLNSKNSLKLNFKTANGIGYRLLIILSLFKEENYSHKLSTDFQKVLDDNTDKIVIWTLKKLPNDTLQYLKNQNINIVLIETKDVEAVSLISNFIPLPSVHYDYSVSINKVANLIIKRLRKLFHIVLSEIAAPIYDKEYGNDANIGTKSIMKYEEDTLNEIVHRIINKRETNQTSIAIDVGCGTGRHSFNIAKYFEKVYGFDFSPKMIEQANATKRKNNVENVIFSVADLEYEELHHEETFKGEVELVIASFGMGSFIEDTSKILRRYNQWLKPSGKILLSFYNRNSIILKITPNWRDTSLAAHIDVENNTLQVKLSEDVIFQIFCKPFDKDVESQIGKLYKIENVYTFPTTMALLPNSLLKNKQAFDIFNKIDHDIAYNKNYNHGHYVLVVAEKVDIAKKEDGFKKVLDILTTGNFTYEILEHELVLSIEDVKRVTEINDESQMIKTVVFKDRKKDVFISVAIMANKKVSKEKIIDLLNEDSIEKTKNWHLAYATEKEIYDLGFPIGGIAPFGFSDTNIITIIDEDIFNSNHDFIFMGIGDNHKTLKIKRKDFLNIAKDFKRVRQ